jgi:hypothetical protein
MKVKNKRKRIKLSNSSVIDFEGNVYPTICIGTQEWIITNLKTPLYNEGVLTEVKK